MSLKLQYHEEPVRLLFERRAHTWGPAIWVYMHSYDVDSIEQTPEDIKDGRVFLEIMDLGTACAMFPFLKDLPFNETVEVVFNDLGPMCSSDSLQWKDWSWEDEV